MVVGTVKMTVVALIWKPLWVPLANLWPQKCPRSCELRVAPVANWHNRQPGIIHQLMRQPPKALPMGLGLCKIWRRGQQCTLSNGTLGYGQQTDCKPVSRSLCSLWQINHKRRHLYRRAESDIVTEGTER